MIHGSVVSQACIWPFLIREKIGSIEWTNGMELVVTLRNGGKYRSIMNKTSQMPGDLAGQKVKRC